MPLARVVELFQHCQIVDELENGEPGIEAKILGQVTEPSTDLYSFTVMTCAPAVESRRARGRGEQGREDAKRRRLAGAVRSQQACDPRADRDVDSIEGTDRTVGAGQVLEDDVHSCSVLSVEVDVWREHEPRAEDRPSKNASTSTAPA